MWPIDQHQRHNAGTYEKCGISACPPFLQNYWFRICTLARFLNASIAHYSLRNIGICFCHLRWWLNRTALEVAKFIHFWRVTKGYFTSVTNKNPPLPLIPLYIYSLWLLFGGKIEMWWLLWKLFDHSYLDTCLIFASKF